MADTDDYGHLLKPLLERAAGYALSILRSRADAEDAVQTASLRGYERLHSYDRSRSFPSWWFSILHNCCIDQLRYAHRRPTCALQQDIVDERHAGMAPDWDALDSALRALSPSHHETVRLRYFADLSYLEIAEVLSIPIGTVMSRLYHARSALAAELKKEAQ